MTNSVKFLADVTISVDKQYSRSYGNAVEYNYDFAIVDGDWIELFDSFVSQGRKKISAKHFHSYTGKEITERTFKMRVKKARKLWQEKISAKKAENKRRMDELKQYQYNLISELPIRIKEVAPKIKDIITAGDIEKRLQKDMTTNEVCNKAVGIVGYQFAKHLGWMNVLQTINNIVYR